MHRKAQEMRTRHKKTMVSLGTRFSVISDKCNKCLDILKSP